MGSERSVVAFLQKTAGCKVECRGTASQKYFPVTICSTPRV